MVVSPLERLFALEVEFHRRLRAIGPCMADIASVHTSYALQSGYEPLLRSIGGATASDLGRLADRSRSASDARDVLAARASVSRLLGVETSHDRAAR
jgi:hypothetical protein